MKSRHHYILLLLTLVLTVVCGVLIPRVNVNSDMTKYLPDDSQMKQGLDVIQTEFQADKLTVPSVKILFPNMSEERREAFSDSLKSLPGVSSVNVVLSEDKQYSLFLFSLPEDVDMKAFGRSIKKSYDGSGVIVETAQDGATPPISILIIAALMIFVVLVSMAQSWLDPVLSLLTIGIAVVLNIGTNALLPSVSITTNYIVAILQAVLALDYSIVLMNRYRQELRDDRQPFEVINAAIRRAYPSILSSASTTIVGLLVLCLMRLKIGMDLGLVLAKGVFFCLICTFTVLPSLLLLMGKAMQKCSKKTFVVPTDRLGRFVTGHKVSMAIFFLLLFSASFYFSRKTNISFSTKGESEIAKIFPETNPYVIIYDLSDEDAIFSLADSLSSVPGVTSVVSYPTLLKQQYNADEMLDYISRLSLEFSEYIPVNDYQDMLTPEIIRMLYSMRSGVSQQFQITFPEMMSFVADNCAENPLFQDFIEEDMRAQMTLLRPLLDSEFPTIDDMPQEESVFEEPEEEIALPLDTFQQRSEEEPMADTITPVQEEPAVEEPMPVVETKEETQMEEVTIVQSAPDSISIVALMRTLYSTYGDADTKYLASIVDTKMLQKPMLISEMSAYLGSSRTQTTMVFTLHAAARYLTPIEFVHFLTDDLFHRKSMASMVTDEQKRTMLLIRRIMDYAMDDAYLNSHQLSQLLDEYGLVMEAEDIRELMLPKPVMTVVKRAVETTAEPEAPDSLTLRANSAKAEQQAAEKDSMPTAVVLPEKEAVLPAQPIVKKPLKKKPQAAPQLSEAERQAEVFVRLMEKKDRAYTASEMASNFRQLGQNLDETTVSLLYSYYASVCAYDDQVTMSTEEMLSYVTDSLLSDPRVSSFIDEEMRASTISTQEQIRESMHLLCSDQHAVMLVLTDLPVESESTYQFTRFLHEQADQALSSPYYMIGESVMLDEMKAGFNDELMRITIFTILAIFLIVCISFRSVVVPTILVMTVLTAVYVNVIFSGLVSGQILYLAYLIVQSILMGATIDYGILYANYYKENRKTHSTRESAVAAYHGSIRTIMTSGLIMILGPGIMAIFIEDVTISSIVGCLAIGAAVAIVLILTVLPAVLVALDRWVVPEKTRKANKESQEEE